MANDLRVADTSALYAFFVESDAHHAKARTAFQSPDPIWVPAEILAETLALLQKRIGAEQARQAGEWLWGAPQVEIQPTDTALLMSTWGEFLADHAGLTYPDAVVVATCREREASPLTFDRRILRALRR